MSAYGMERPRLSSARWAHFAANDPLRHEELAQKTHWDVYFTNNWSVRLDRRVGIAMLDPRSTCDIPRPERSPGAQQSWNAKPQKVA